MYQVIPPVNRQFRALLPLCHGVEPALVSMSEITAVQDAVSVIRLETADRAREVGPDSAVPDRHTKAVSNRSFRTIDRTAAFHPGSLGQCDVRHDCAGARAPNIFPDRRPRGALGFSSMPILEPSCGLTVASKPAYDAAL